MSRAVLSRCVWFSEATLALKVSSDLVIWTMFSAWECVNSSCGFVLSLGGSV